MPKHPTYTLTVGGQELTFRLSDEDAKRYGATPVKAKARDTVPNKARTPAKE